MTGTMTWVGLDVHARSTHAAAIDSMTGELVRRRFGAGVSEPVAWLEGLTGPVRACYEAGPTGFGLYRAAVAAGINMQVIAPGKTPRGSSDRVKTDRRDAELLARCLLAGSLKAVTVSPAGVEAARELTRAHDACRRDLMNARHRVSKMLLRHGVVYRKENMWSQEHRRWLARQQLEQEMSAFVFADLVARVDGLTARKMMLAEWISRLALDPEFWPTVARLRAFRGVDTLTALSIDLELGADWQRFEKPTRLGAWLGLTPVVDPVRRVLSPGRDHQDRVRARTPAAGRISVALQPGATDRRDPPEPPARTARACAADLQRRAAAHPSRLSTDASPRQTPPRDRRRVRPRAGLLSVGRCHRPPSLPPTAPGFRRPGRRAAQRPARATQL